MFTSMGYLDVSSTFFICLLVSLATYLLTAFGIYGMGKKLGVSKPWLAFIPVANVYAFGKIAQHYIKQDGTPSAKFSKILLAFEIIILVLSLVLTVALLFGFVIEVMSYPDVNAYFESEAFASSGFFTFIMPIVLIGIAIVVLAIINMVISYVALWRIFAIFDPDTATLYLVLSIFINILQPIFIFVLRNREPEILVPAELENLNQENIM